MSVKEESPGFPMSKSHFAKFDNFTPKDDATFDDEFARLASSQNWVPGSQVYTQERTIAMREELQLHYFSQTKQPDGKLTEEEQLEGYQNLCREVRIPVSDSIAECKKNLKNTLVNIVDLIDARRVQKDVKVWDDFEAFRAYTLQDEHRINMQEAKEDGGYLASLLQRLNGPRSRNRKGGKGHRSKSERGSGRIEKRRSASKQTRERPVKTEG
ncbi:uncharacterized protein FOBCDRAFT_276310 [Fusarium oxysporum Fo47]|uniref:Uncharacterized protein n=1 Tax=Fusarium oxysporum Fo47 TaxID=660027 RepID=W9J7V0_FUSOX|nr:uncharacterized protein FOBCDRAFT_276310 [Fusarium oxysporum Fo47]EWZ27936.1 hypothetical protein FOZG_18352 [Fusarium oxysporum Fo47]QKD56724.1 hypothetical protein FOBCDRAFT_276310 [Fusarium oxysporum Fo47]